MAYKESFLRGVLKEGIFALIIKGLGWLFQIGSPIVVVAMTIIAGALQGTPIAYVIAAATLAGSATVTLLLRLDEWRAKRTPANKLTLSVPRIVFDYVRDATSGEITGIEYAQLNMGLCNSATFGLSYIVDEVFSSVDGHYNQDARFILNGVLPPSYIQVYRQDRIDMRSLLLKPRVEARLKFKIRYGRPGHEKYSTDRNSIITCVLDNRGYENQLPQDVTQ